MIVWIRFPCLPAEYYDHNFLMRVGAKVGRPINIDTATSLVSRASFARVCVEVDITKPLLAKFTLKNRVRPVVYEGLHLICFKCGMYGHNAENCHLSRDGEASPAPASDDGQPATTPGTSNGQKGDANGKVVSNMETALIRPEITEDYGTWMLAPKQKRNYAKHQGNRYNGEKENGKKNQQGAEKGKAPTVQSGSRFVSLEDTSAVEEDQDTEELTGGQMGNQSHTKGTKQSAQAKGKSPTAQVSQKQIMGNNQHGLHRRQPEIGESSKKRNNNNQLREASRNQAGAASDHTLVLGDKTGAKSVTVVDTENED
ncbi:uncharacterized protein LOC116013097 [Ipomoea triloba]|uniref:uncharacterized protein LOC116013097 n=1 Tax=Ipomoea triloba TaxID=35885 RepID=UPI00125D6805|nr:uncharacterized protein LOC116013097 [Ipomoea triloba]